MKKIKTLVLLTALCTSAFAQAVDVKDIVNPAYYDELMKNKCVILDRDDGSNELRLLPKFEKESAVKENLVQKKEGDYPYTYESLYFLNKQDILKTSNSSAKNIDLNDVSRVCRSISKMQGMTYYSTTRKKELVLYKKAFTIASADSKTPIPDNNTGNADGQVLYAYQDDNSFGVTRYELHYYQNQEEGELLAVFTNKDVMGIGPFKAIYPDNLVINLMVKDCGENLLLYICADLDSVNFPGIKGQITDSISSRMDAIYKWFLKQF